MSVCIFRVIAGTVACWRRSRSSSGIIFERVLANVRAAHGPLCMLILSSFFLWCELYLLTRAMLYWKEVRKRLWENQQEETEEKVMLGHQCPCTW